MVSVSGWSRWTAAPLGLAAAALAWRRDVALAVLAYVALLASGLTWPMPAYAAWLAFVVAQGAQSRSWPVVELVKRPKPLSAVLGIVIGIVAGLAAIALFGHGMRWHPIVVPLPWPGLIGIAFFAVAGSVFNAIGEELVWRAMVPRLIGPERPMVVSVVVPGVSFGMAHYFGLPSGWWGVLAASVYGTALSALHRRHGFLTCVIAHLLTDVILFYWALRWAFFVT